MPLGVPWLAGLSQGVLLWDGGVEGPKIYIATSTASMGTLTVSSLLTRSIESFIRLGILSSNG